MDPAGNKIKLRKSYASKVKNLGLEGLNKAVPNQSELEGLVDPLWSSEVAPGLTMWDQRWQEFRLGDAAAETDLLGKLNSALQFQLAVYQSRNTSSGGRAWVWTRSRWLRRMRACPEIQSRPLPVLTLRGLRQLPPSAVLHRLRQETAPVRSERARREVTATAVSKGTAKDSKTMSTVQMAWMTLGGGGIPTNAKSERSFHPTRILRHSLPVQVQASGCGLPEKKARTCKPIHYSLNSILLRSGLDCRNVPSTGTLDRVCWTGCHYHGYQQICE